MVGGGGEAKTMISEGNVLVNNKVEVQKRKKIQKRKKELKVKRGIFHQILLQSHRTNAQ